ncbi:hypothetical protein KUCAC02_011738, partial [Chaenocephalus aceratus]
LSAAHTRSSSYSHTLRPHFLSTSLLPPWLRAAPSHRAAEPTCAHCGRPLFLRMARDHPARCPVSPVRNTLLIAASILLAAQ